MKSLVWNYFKPAVDDRAKCNFCGQLIVAKNSCMSYFLFYIVYNQLYCDALNLLY